MLCSSLSVTYGRKGGRVSLNGFAGKVCSVRISRSVGRVEFQGVQRRACQREEELKTSWTTTSCGFTKKTVYIHPARSGLIWKIERYVWLGKVCVTGCSADEVTLIWYMDEVPSLHRDVFCLLIVYTEYV
jgi:hypothetical protein